MIPIYFRNYNYIYIYCIQISLGLQELTVVHREAFLKKVEKQIFSFMMYPAYFLFNVIWLKNMCELILQNFQQINKIYIV